MKRPGICNVEPNDPKEIGRVLILLLLYVGRLSFVFNISTFLNFKGNSIEWRYGQCIFRAYIETFVLKIPGQRFLKPN